jgi:hypothetical protein
VGLFYLLSGLFFISYRHVVYDVLGLKMFSPCLLIDEGFSRP